MTTVRTIKNKDNPYTTINNIGLNDETLTYAARGLLAWILSKPDNWHIEVDTLIKGNPKGREHVYSILRELTNAGYSHLRKYQNEKGQWITERLMFETPELNPYFDDDEDSETPTVDSPTASEPTTGNPYFGGLGRILNTDNKVLKEKEPSPPSSCNTHDVPEKATENADGSIGAWLATPERKDSPLVSDSLSQIYKWYEGDFGMVGYMTGERLKEMEQEYPLDWIREAFSLAVDNNARNLAYVGAILNRWRTQGKNGKKKMTSKKDDLYNYVIPEDQVGVAIRL